MKTKKLGQILVNDALIILDEAQQSFTREHWHRTVRKSQEALEECRLIVERAEKIVFRQ